MNKKFFILFTTAVLLVAAGFGCTKVEVKKEVVDFTPIKIGWLGPLTEDLSSLGSLDRKSVELAIKEINEAGGIYGRPFQVIYEDGMCDSKTASNAGNKLINIEKVAAIIGGYCSGETLAVAPVAEQNKVIMLSPASTAPSITDAGDYIFRDVPSDNYQGKYAANFVYYTLNKRKAAVLYAATDYATALGQVFESEFKELGGEIVSSDSFLQTTRDLRTQITKVKNSGADVLYFPTYTESAVAGLNQIKQLGLNIPVVGPETLSDPKVVAADGAEGLLYTTPVTKEDVEFKSKFASYTQSEVKELPTFSAQSYDAAKILALAFKSAGGGASIELVKNEMYKIKNFAGVSGQISFDKNGDLVGTSYEVMVVKGGKAEKYQ